MSFWTPKPHRHHWLEHDSVNLTLPDGKKTGIILVYNCWACGSIRYDKVDGNGFVSSTVTDDKGAVMSGNADTPAAAAQAREAA